MLREYLPTYCPESKKNKYISTFVLAISFTIMCNIAE